MKRLVQALLIASLLCSPSVVTAQPCAGYGVDVAQQGAEEYDPSAGSGVVLALRITAVSNESNSCQSAPIEIRAQDEGLIEPSFSGRPLALDLFQSSKTLQLSFSGARLTGNARNEVLAGGSVIPLFVVRPGQFVPAGTYRELLQVIVGDRPPIVVEVIIRVRSAVRFVPENGSNTKTLSFGEVSQGASRTSSIYYVANGPFEIRASSENRGNLLHEMGANFGTIRYSASYDGQPLDLSAGPTTIQRMPNMGSVTIDQLAISIAPQTDKYAGRYTDVLTLEYIAY